jgi:hypothetical protein
VTRTANEEVASGLLLHSTMGRVALAATVAASGMASLDATVVNVALPHIGKDFSASVSALQWVLTGYLLALASLILLLEASDEAPRMTVRLCLGPRELGDGRGDRDQHLERSLLSVGELGHLLRLL